MSQKNRMTNGQKLEELIHTYLVHLVKNTKDDFVPEFELRFTGCVNGEYTNRPQPISKDDYYNVLKVFKSIQPSISSFSTSGEYLLRIYPYYNGRPSPFRCEITGIQDIQKYCITNDWKTCPSAKFVRKEKVYDDGKPVEDVYMDSYAIKASYKREVSYIGHQIEMDPQLKDISKNWNKVEKTFRHMNRVSFSVGEEGLIKVDASIVKSSNQDDRGNFIPVRDIHQSGVFKNFEKHEIELELSNENILTHKPNQGTSNQYAKLISREMQKTIRKVQVGLQKSPFPIPKDEMVQILENYIRVIHGAKKETPIERIIGRQGITSPKNFIGPSSVTLQFENIYSPEESNNTSNLPCVKKGYTVTEKADGTRCLLFIAENMKIYLIDMNLNVIYTGIQLKKGLSVKNIILDGEYITKDKNSTPISSFMAFDMYFNSFGDIRQLPFIPTNDKNGRYPLLQMFVGIINSEIQDEIEHLSTNSCKLGVKQFILIDDQETDYEFHKSCRAVLEMDHIYNVDGLIFTPAFLAVGAESHSPFVPGPITKIRWTHSFKWKPPQYNTNDFLATTLKAEDNTNKDKITNLVEPNTTAGEPIQMSQYKTLELRCGFSQKNSGYLDAFSRILTKQRMRRYREEFANASHYIPTLFYPTDYPDKYAHVCNVMLKPDENGLMQMFTEEGEIFDDDTIVEFRYEKSNSDGFKWIPLRVRNDKTHEYRKGLKSYGNDYETANNNWKSIMNPITEEMLITGELPPFDEVIMKGDTYYTKSNAGDRDILQKFHNYVKEQLIITNTQRGQTLIDVACGKAGDLWKWEKADVSFVFGVDYSRDNIENRFDGAAARYMNYYMERGETFRCIFVNGDSSKNIRNGDAFSNERNKIVSDAVFGIGGGARDSIIGDLYGIGANGFDVCSCQFAIHYFFHNTTTLQGFMTNVCQNVKVGGVFLGTCYDGKALFNRFKSSGVDDIVIHSGKTVYWKCSRKYTETEFEDDSSSLGYAIDVYQKSIGTVHTEYLVNFDYLIRVMDNYGFKVVNITSFKDIYEKLGRNASEKYRELGRMEENLITFLNNTFVFQKVRDVDANLVVLDATPIEERKEASEIEEKPVPALEPEQEPEPVPATAPAPAPAPAKKNKTRKCKETEELVDEKCLKKCTEDEIRNPVTKRCNKTKKNK